MKWTKTKLGEFAPFVYGKGLPQAKRIEGEIPVYGSNGIVGTHSEAFVKEPAVIIGRKGSVGEVHLSKGQSWPIDTAFFALGSQNTDLKFLYYLLKTLPITSNSDSAVPGLNRDFAHSLEILVPEIRGQIVIGEILANLDAKISANENLSRTLEGIAQTIFKSWFVDFDPVKAKMSGEKLAGMEAAIAGLFPNSMEESEIGLIPSGWNVKPAAELFEVGIGRTPPRKEPQWFCNGTEGIPWVSIRDMGTFETYSHGTNEGLTQAAVDKFKVPVVPENTVLMSFKLTVGKLCISDTDLVTNEAIAHFKISQNSPLNTFYTYLSLSNLDMGSLDSTSSIGTATNSGVIKQIRFLVPPQELLGNFHNKVSPIFSQLKILRKQTTNLVLLRDALLPRLISGELQIPEDMLAS